MGHDPEIVVVGGAEEARVDIRGQLAKAGFGRVFSCETVAIAGDAADLPDLLVLVGAEVRSLCAQAREAPPLAGVPILAVVPSIPADESAAALAAGADDVIVAPAHPTILAARARNLARSAQLRDQAHQLDKLGDATRRIQHQLAARAGLEGLREALQIACSTLRFDRASIIANVESSLAAYVIAATDDPTLSKFTLHVEDYPEMREAMTRGSPVLIDDVLDSPITEPVVDTLAQKKVRGVAVFPVRAHSGSLGVVLMRRERAGVSDLDRRRIAFGELFSEQIAVQLSHGKIIQSLREQTGKISRARYEAERRLRMIDSLKEHFEAAADGVVVLDERGHILFVNYAAEQITGFARDGLLGTSIVDLVPSLQADALLEVIRSVLDGTNLEAFDLELGTTAGEPICVSVTTSTVLSSSGAVILSFRDVTAQRVLEVELRKTKDFLEKLIDSTVDAIVAADINGTVILFNQGAERIYGYSADDVVGKLSVWRLYPDGVAKQVMRMLRSVSYGGVGRLEQTRREIVNKSGELVPVNMTASIIYEDGREVATVGIFSDLRERIRIEQRLLRAQEKLQLTEKQALIAELAGAAAHELNQPLTSIIGYAQLIERQSEADAQHLRAVSVILREADRMADIVKKIGRITKFEIKEYVGDTNILDLDKSAAQSSPDLVIPEPAGGDDDDEPEIVIERHDDDDEPEIVIERHDDERESVGGRRGSERDIDTRETTRMPILRDDDRNEASDGPVSKEEPTVVGHRARLFGDRGSVDLDGEADPHDEQTLDEIDLESALDNPPESRRKEELP